VDQQQPTPKPEPRAKEIAPSKLNKRRKTHGTRRGFFTPLHPEKYDGDINTITYRSKMELRMMKYLDDQPSVLRWSSEETVIPYYSPLDKKMHRYFVDFKVITKNRDGKITTRLVECKWSTATVPPKEPKRKTRRYFAEQKNWIINQAKWTEAKKFCDQHGWEWMILTEKHLSGF
jgi:hypothetical protein